MSMAVFIPANKAWNVLLEWSNLINREPSTFMKTPNIELDGILATYFPFIGLNTFLDDFNSLSISLFKENVSPRIMKQPSLPELNSAAIIICDASAPLGAPIVKGATNLSGNALAWATKAMGALMLSSLSNIGVSFMPSPAS